jgi:hypothetical protein
MRDIFGYPYKYIIDSSSLIFLKLTYPRDMFKPVWDKMTDLMQVQILVSCEDVYEELKVKDDELLSWASNFHSNFLPLTNEIQLLAKEILKTHSNILDLKKRKSSADPFVISTAIHYQCSVVTQEKPSGGHHKSKIPDVCKFYNVDCFNLLELLDNEGFKI